jgi:hypothetical protein
LEPIAPDRDKRAAHECKHDECEGHDVESFLSGHQNVVARSGAGSAPVAWFDALSVAGADGASSGTRPPEATKFDVTGSMDIISGSCTLVMNSGAKLDRHAIAATTTTAANTQRRVTLRERMDAPLETWNAAIQREA